MISWRIALLGLGYAVGAVLLALLVILPVFWLINVVYDDGARIMVLLVAVVLAWGVLAWLLSRRKIRL